MMNDNGKTKAQLIDELAQMRRRIAELESSETQLKLIKEELWENAEKYRNLVEWANDGILIVQDGKIKYANKRLAERYGYTIKDIVNTPFGNYVHADAASKLSDRHTQPVVTENIESPYEVVLKCEDGSDVYAEINADSISYRGKPAALVFIHDVTERKQADEKEREHVHDLTFLSRTAMDLVELSPEEDIYQFTAQRLTELASDSVIIVNSVDEASTTFHIRAILGIEERMDTLIKIIGRDPIGMAIPISEEARDSLTSGRLEKVPGGLYQLAGSGLPKAICCAIEKLLDVGDTYAMGFSWKRELYGSAIVLVSKGSTLINPSIIETFISQVSVALQRKQAETQLTQTMADLTRSNAELEQFVYVVSHDLREPLRMVASYVELLERRYKDKLDADAKDFIAYATDGAHRMQDLIDDVLAYSRVGTRGKSFQPTDCNIIFRDAKANLKMAIEEVDAVVTHDHLPTIMADGVQLISLLQNLIGNAIKFHGQRTPRVHVSAEPNENEWVFSISDNGIGIAAEDIERIFVISQRLHSRAEYPGTGIGLAICKKIVNRHGGRIWVDSEPGKGSTFYFTIPVTGNNKYE
jgi:PAS domain S-box-containing protein